VTTESNEKRAKRIRHHGEVERAILSAVASAGVLSLAVLAPNTLKLLSYVPDKGKFGFQSKNATTRLAKKGLVSFEKREGKTFIVLTNSGKHALALKKQKHALIRDQKRKWDKRWRMVIFDVPEKQKVFRNRFRKLMQEVGFFRLQDSVWVFPYDCEEFVALLRVELKIRRSVLYVVAETIENDTFIRRHFKLK
jgi:DNA-binding transcriptional regulator PaaX